MGAIDLDEVDVVGVAPKCTLIPVRINANFEPAVLEAAIEYAGKVGDVILMPRYLPRVPVSNVYDTRRLNDQLHQLEATLRRIARLKPVVCAAGNDGTSSLVYPASLEETIAVGACNEKGYRSTYSQYGKGLDVVAPSNDGSVEDRTMIRLDPDDRRRREEQRRQSKALRDGRPVMDSNPAERTAPQAADDLFGGRSIATTDNLGEAGYNFEPEGDDCKAEGFFGFGGTSAASAQVAGVIALMLAADPSLRNVNKTGEAASAIDVTEIRRRLRDAASMTHLRPNGEPTPEFGFGLVDAAKAVGSRGR